MLEIGDTLSEQTCQAIRRDILVVIPDATVEVGGSGGHFTIGVVSDAFEGKGLLARQRLVYGAIKDLMAGDDAPVHAVDSLSTRTLLELRA